jgi:hypothetical protein
VAGSGFSAPSDARLRTSVAICGQPCSLLSANTTSLECTTAPLSLLADVAAQPRMVLLQGSVFGTGATAARYMEFFDGSVDDTGFSAACSVGFDVGPEMVAWVRRARLHPRPGRFTNVRGGVFEVSNSSTGPFAIIAQVSATLRSGWNELDVVQNVTGRFVRFRAPSCSVTEVQILGHRVFASSNTTCGVNVTISAVDSLGVPGPSPVSIAKDAGFEYARNVTAVVVSVSPSVVMGGGEVVTLQGFFPVADSTVVRVLLCDVRCNVTSVNVTTVVCVSGSTSAPVECSSQSAVRVWLSDSGAALVQSPSVLGFRYCSAWSSPATWLPQTQPSYLTEARIPAGRCVVLNVSPPLLRAVIVEPEGQLLWGDLPVNLTAGCILILGGTVTIGSGDAPYVHRSTITLVPGLVEPWVMARSCDAAIVVMNGGGRGAEGAASAFSAADQQGSLSIRAAPRGRTWSTLRSAVAAGATEVTVTADVDARVDDEVLLTSDDDCDRPHGATEVSRVVGVISPQTFLLWPPLRHKHGGTSTLTVDAQSNTTTVCDGVGACGPPSGVRVSLAEVCLCVSPSDRYVCVPRLLCVVVSVCCRRSWRSFHAMSSFKATAAIRQSATVLWFTPHLVHSCNSLVWRSDTVARLVQLVNTASQLS